MYEMPDYMCIRKSLAFLDVVDNLYDDYIRKRVPISCQKLLGENFVFLSIATIGGKSGWVHEDVIGRFGIWDSS